MEGVVDAVLRELLTQQGGIDACVTEFIRVTNHLIGDDVFFRYCPELLQSCKTTAGTPVFIQLLGSDVNAMAENAAKAANLGALGVDLNFGCPAKTVNSHDGGAALLKTPERLFHIVSAVRKAVPSHIPVSAKIRLGFDTTEHVMDLAHAVSEAQASWLCVHARTKMDGYKPPAYWKNLAPLTEKLSLPIIANGEVWNANHHTECQTQAQTPHVMIGRGLVANPGLALEITQGSKIKSWENWQTFILSFLEKSRIFRHENYAVQRVKQLTKMMGQTHGEALLLMEEIKRLQNFLEMEQCITHHFSSLQNKKMAQKIPSPQMILPRKMNTSHIVRSAQIS